MGVTTTADEMLYRIRGYLKEAAKELAQLVFDEDIWGVDEFKDEFRAGWPEALRLLTEARSRLRA